jgi:hypothetical protein
MNLLLDTHVLLWWLDDHPDLSLRAKTAIADGQNLVFVSTVFYNLKLTHLIKIITPKFDHLLLCIMKVVISEPWYGRSGGAPRGGATPGQTPRGKFNLYVKD